MQYVLVSDDKVIEAVADRLMTGTGNTIEIDSCLSPDELLGRKIVTKDSSKLKIAVICNWRSQCGISSYTKYLVDCLKEKVAAVRIYSEDVGIRDFDIVENVVRSWTRGENMNATTKLIKEWGADFVIIQHEFGIFPIATHFLRMLQSLGSIPYAVVLHSTYDNHLDKTISTAAISNIIVHSDAAKNVLVSLGHDASGIQVIPHGCVVYDEIKPLWNCFQTPYAIVQFGFGFKYKGVDRAIEAIAHLKDNDPKFKNIFYVYLCSLTEQARNYHSDYFNYLNSKIQELGVEENVAIIQKFNTEQIITNYLRTAKMALFPYLTDPENTVYGASGALRIAMANEIPVVASESHLFDDLEGIVPRPKDYLELSSEIDKIFSDSFYKDTLLQRNHDYVRNNSWSVTADRYLEAIDHIMSSREYVQV